MMFPTDYATSRELFQDAAARLGWSCQSHYIGQTGPDGGKLTIDAAISPAPQAERVLVASSGLHGVEAPFGAAVQLAAMDAWADGREFPSGVRCVFLHALNPYGFAWGRRVDGDNIDPNRNFLLAGEEYHGSPDGYKDFDPLLNARTPPSRWDFFALRAWLLVQRHGLPALKQALVIGQYDFPKGIFFGGHGPGSTHQALRHRLRAWIGPATSVLHLDFHTGLGDWGTFKLLLDAPTTPEQRARLDRWFGPGSHEDDNPNGVAYLPRGSFGPWCVAQQLAPDYLYAVAEFGTYGTVAMMTGIRAENQAHHWGRPGGMAERRARERLAELFCPSDPNWRRRVLTQGVDLVSRAVAGLAETPLPSLVRTPCAA
jgi:hypothetical protein